MLGSLLYEKVISIRTYSNAMEVKTQPQPRSVVIVSSAHFQVESLRQSASRVMIYRPVKVPTITQWLLGNRIALIGSYHARARAWSASHNPHCLISAQCSGPGQAEKLF